MEINKKELLDVLSILRPALADKSIVEQMGHFIFKDGEILTYNDKLCIKIPYEAITENFSVDGIKFYNLLREFKSDTIKLTFKDNQVVLKEGSQKATINLIEEDSKLTEFIDALLEDLEEEVEWVQLPEDFKKAVELCAPTASKDASSGILQSLYFKGDKVYSTDRQRISRYVFSADTGLEEFLVKSDYIANILDQAVEFIRLSKAWVHFASEDGLSISMRRMGGKYLDGIDDIVDVENYDLEFPVPEELAAAVKRSTSILNDVDALSKKVSISIEPKKVVVFSENKGNSTYTEDVSHKNKVEESTTFNTHPDRIIGAASLGSKFFIGYRSILIQSDNFSHAVAIGKEIKKEE